MFANSDNGGGTDWALKSVPEMWSMLAAHDGTAHKNLLLTWQQSAELLIDHLSRVKRYRDNLAEAWPPDKSRAAEKYLDRLDDLISHLNSTYHAAVENHRALGAATSALVGARAKLESIYRAYLQNQNDLDAYAQKLQANRQVVGKYRIIAPTPPTAAETLQYELQLQAQSVMSTLSTDLAVAQLNITTPNRYEPAQKIGHPEPLDGAGDSSSPFRPKATSLSNQSGVDAGVGATPSHLFSPPASGDPVRATPISNDFPAIPQTSPTGPQPPGPTLSGLPPTVNSPSSPAEMGTTSGNGIPPQSSGFSTIPSPGTGSQIPRTATNFPGTGASGASSSSLGRGIQEPIPGGVIGGSPAIGGTRGQPSISRVQKINPSGGVIGHPGAPGSTLRQSTSSSEGGNPRKVNWDPEDPWATEVGISPILLPAEKQVIDPGPAIGLPPHE